MTAGKTVAAYGTWPSEISAAMIAESAISLGGVLTDGGDLYWLEGRPSEGGRVVLVRHSESGAFDITPEGYSVRTRVHEYGGGAALISDGEVFFVNFADQRIYCQPVNGTPAAVTGETGDRYADMSHDKARNRLICVRERHEDAGVANALVSVSLEDGSVSVLDGGHDFVSNPRISPDGKRLSWLSWELPDMPWDATALWVAEIGSDGTLGIPVKVAGGGHESIFQPEWRPDGSLVFVSDRTGWWNLHCWDGGSVAALFETDAEFGLPQWVFGMRTYDVRPDGSLVCAWSREGRWQLGVFSDGILTAFELPDDDISGVRVCGDRVAYIGGSPRAPAAVVSFDSAAGTRNVVRRSFPGDLDPAHLSKPLMAVSVTPFTTHLAMPPVRGPQGNARHCWCEAMAGRQEHPRRLSASRSSTGPTGVLPSSTSTIAGARVSGGRTGRRFTGNGASRTWTTWSPVPNISCPGGGRIRIDWQYEAEVQGDTPHSQRSPFAIPSRPVRACTELVT